MWVEYGYVWRYLDDKGLKIFVILGSRLARGKGVRDRERNMWFMNE